MINTLEKQFLNTEYKKPEAEDWHKDLAYQKFEYQKQKDFQKIEAEKEALKSQRFNGFLKLITILCCILFTPFILVVYGASKIK